ncbi:nucleoside monophosphate kinase [Patescibacteria group bacterium]|nr:nucleoside monophosphate kinase [Patescibacteria group bacterium]
MKDLEFPLFKTKIEGSPKFDLTDFEQRKEYFELKAGDEIKKIKEYLNGGNTFIAYFLGKKNSGKGTYAKMFREIFGKENIAHLSIGDMIREIDKELQDPEQKKELLAFLEKNYRGFISLEDILASLEKRSTSKLLPSELILALAKREISRLGKKSIFIDGFPRELDQVSYSLFFRDLVDYRQDPDVMILIDIPEPVINARIKHRVICPLCNTSRSLKLLTTQKVEHEDGKFHLICDNSDCTGAKMVPKEGDEKGIEPIKDRLALDEMLIKRAFSLYGIPKVLLRNSVPIDKAEEYLDDYEITPEYSYELEGDKIKTIEKPWQVVDDNNQPSYSLMPPPVVVSLIKQLVESLGI